MSFEETIAAQQRPAQRPKNPNDLLLHAIADDPANPPDNWRATWATEHAREHRFYVGGWNWFAGATGSLTDNVLPARVAALQLIKREEWDRKSGWRLDVIKKSRDDWQKMARQQYFNVVKRRAVPFVKAAIFMVTCELTLQELINRREAGDLEPGDAPPPEIESGEAVYSNMAVVPAVWNVNDFNGAYIEQHLALDDTFLDRLAKPG